MARAIRAVARKIIRRTENNMPKIKSKKIIAIIVALIIPIIFLFFNFSKKDNNAGKNKPATDKNAVFVLLDDKEGLVWEEKTKLSEQSRKFYSDKIKNIKEKIANEKKESELVVLYNNLALYESYLGKYRESYELYLKALGLKSDYRVIWLSLGDLLAKMKAFKSAEAAYEKAISLNKYIGMNYVKLANLYKVENPEDYDRIEDTYKRGIENTEQSLNEDNGVLLKEYAVWLGDVGKKKEAIKIYERLKEKQPQNKEAFEREINKLK